MRCLSALGKLVGSQYGTAVVHLLIVAWWQVGEFSLCTLARIVWEEEVAMYGCACRTRAKVSSDWQ